METTITCPLPLLAAVIDSTSPDRVRAIITGVCLYVRPASSMVAATASTDSYRLTIASMSTGAQDVEGVRNQVSRDVERIILTDEVVNNILKAAGKREHSQTTHVRIGITGRDVTWALLIAADALNGVYSASELGARIEGDFPDIQSLTTTKGKGPTFLSNESYHFNPVYFAGPADIMKSLARFVESPPKKGYSFNGIPVSFHGTGEGSNLKPAMFTMYPNLKKERFNEPQDTVLSVVYLVMPVRNESTAAYPNRPAPNEAAVIVDKWVADNRATYDYTVDTPCPPKRTAYTLHPEGDAAFATAWRKWMNHCDWIAEGVEPCQNDPRYAWWMKHVNTDVSGLDASDFYSTDDVEPGGVPVVAS
jgi:hypothetical protein